MSENKSIFLKKIFGLCNIYLGLFTILGLVASMYIGMTNHKAHEVLFNKSLTACLFVVILTAVLFLLPMKMRINLTVSHFLLFFGLFLINALLEIPFNEAPWAAQRAGIRWDKRNKYQVVRDFRKEGINAYPIAFFSAFITRQAFFEKNFNLRFGDNMFPLSGISNVRTVLCNETGKWISYLSDRYGFNNDDSVYKNMHNSIVLVGDSFTHGECVEREDNIASNLTRRGYTAISLGTGGNGPLAELATLKEYGPSLTPKIILWMYFDGNDFLDLPTEYSFQPLRQYLDKGHTQNLIQKQNQIDEFWIHFFHESDEYLKKETQNPFWEEDRKEDVKGLVLRLVSLHNLRERLGFSRNSYLFQDSSDETEIMFRTVMKAALEEAESLHSKLYFVYLPSFSSVFNEKYSLAPSSQKVRKVVSELGIPLIDFHEYLKNEKDPASFFPFRTVGHYNPKGYNLLADLIETKALHDIKK